MIARSTRLLMEVLIGLLAGLIILTGIVIWRLSVGPVVLDFLTPRLEAVFNDPDSDLTIDIGRTVLSWSGWPNSLDLHAEETTITDDQGFTLLALPDVRVKLSLRALLKGMVAPTIVEIVRPRLNLVRGPDGEIQLGATGGEDATEGDTVGLPRLLAQLLAQPDYERPLDYLSTLRIVGGEVSVNDQRLLTVWRAPEADIDLRRDPVGLAGDAVVALELAGQRTALRASFVYRRDERSLALDGGFEGFRPDSIAEMLPDLEAYRGFRLPLDGDVAVDYALDEGLRRLDFTISGGAGELGLANLFATPRGVRELRLAGRYQGAERSLEVWEGLVRFSDGTTGAGPSVALTGEAVASGDRVELDLGLTLDRIATDEIVDYWPEQLAANGRNWVVGNVEQGFAENARIGLQLSLPTDDPGAAEVTGVEVTFDYSDLNVHFLRPMPPVTGVSGSASFDGSTMTFLPTSGHYGDVQVVSSKIEILGLESERHSMAITVGLTGPLESELRALDHERLKLIEPLGIDPGDIGGTGEAGLELRFPLLKDLKIEQMEIAAQAELKDVSAKSIVLGLDMTKGQLSLKLNKAGMRVTGPLQLAGVPLALVWQEDFTGTQEPRTAMQVLISRVDERGLSAAGLDFRPYVGGPVSASLVAHMRRDGTTAIQSAVNLEQALIDLPFLKWRKLAGVPGEARFQVVLKHDKLVGVEQLTLIAGGLEAKGRVGFADGSKDFTSVALERIRFGRNDLTDVRVQREGKGFAIDFGSGELDAAPYLERDDETVEAAEADGPKTPLGLSARNLSRVYVGEAQWLERVDVALDRSTAGWERVRLVGYVPQELRHVEGDSASSFDDSRVQVTFAPDGRGRYDIAIDSNDMGSLLAVFDILDTVVGGSLEVRGKSDSPALEGPMLVDIEAQDYKLQNAPALAQLLTVASLTGIVDILSGEGISFQRLTGSFVYDDGELSTELARAYGPAIGLTARGTIAFERDQVDLEGTVVPAYTINRVLGAIPVLGWILVGGEGEGVLAVTYQMKGDLARPQVTVNPLAALAPGFLRGLFGFLGSDGAAADARPRLFPGNRGR